VIPGRGKPRLPDPPIELSKVLLVEGRDAVGFFEALLVEIGLASEIELRNMGGNPEFKPNLKALIGMESFRNGVTSIGIVRDAESIGARSAFQSVQDSLKAAGLRAPDLLNTTLPGEPSVSVYILPDCEESGMLEDLCLQAVSEDPTFACVKQYIECLRETYPDKTRNLSKVGLHSFLSAQEKPGLKLGEAAQGKYLNLQSPAYDSLKLFLQNI
jgi:hypothetical protein